MNNHDEAEKALQDIKRLFDAWYKGVIVISNNDSDFGQHVYSVASIMGIVGNAVYSGLNKDIPTPKYIKDRR